MGFTILDFVQKSTLEAYKTEVPGLAPDNGHTNLGSAQQRLSSPGTSTTLTTWKPLQEGVQSQPLSRDTAVEPPDHPQSSRGLSPCHCTSSPHKDEITPSQRDQLAVAITKTHATLFTTPALFVNVKFEGVSATSYYVGGNGGGV